MARTNTMVWRIFDATQACAVYQEKRQSKGSLKLLRAVETLWFSWGIYLNY